MKIAIIGTGGVGGYFGGKLAQAGIETTFLARGKHLKSIQTSGLRVKSINGDFIIQPVKVTDKLHEMPKADLIILCLKAWQIGGIIDELPLIMHDDTVILPTQNGITTADELKAKLNPKKVLGGLCRIFSRIEEPGIINHFGGTPSIVFGEFDREHTVRTQQIKNIFDQAGFHSGLSDDIEADLWKKFIPICTGGLLAVTRATYGEIREIKETRQLMIDLLLEIYRLSQKLNVRLNSDFIDKTISMIDSFDYDATASMARDIWNGKPSEIDYQNGTVVQLAKKNSVPAPVNEFVYQCILPMELKARQHKI
jgi:2-dehydropantoate 2-reductase